MRAPPHHRYDHTKSPAAAAAFINFAAATAATGVADPRTAAGSAPWPLLTICECNYNIEY